MDQTRHSILSVQKLRSDLCSLLEISKLRVTGTVSQRDQQHFLSTSTFQFTNSVSPIIQCSTTIIPKHFLRFSIFQMHIVWNSIRWYYGLPYIIQFRTVYADRKRSCYELYIFYYFLFTNGIAHFRLLHWRVFAARVVFLVAQQNFLRVCHAIDSLTVS